MRMKTLIASLRDIATIVGRADNMADDLHEAANDLNDIADDLADNGITTSARRPKKKLKPRKVLVSRDGARYSARTGRKLKKAKRK